MLLNYPFELSRYSLAVIIKIGVCFIHRKMSSKITAATTSYTNRAFRLAPSRILDSMKLPGQRSGFHICDILDLNNSTNNTSVAEPKHQTAHIGGGSDGLHSAAASAPVAIDTQHSPPTPPGTSPPTLHHGGQHLSGGGAPGAAARFGLPLHHHHQQLGGLQQPMNADEAALQHHYLTGRHHPHSAAASAAAVAGAMMGNNPYNTQSSFNHAMLSAEWAIAASSMFPGAKPWFHDQENYGECLVKTNPGGKCV